MPRTYTDEEKADIWRDYETYSPGDRAKTDKLIGPPPSVQTTPQTTPKATPQTLQGPRLTGATLDDPRDTSPWYQRLLKQIPGALKRGMGSYAGTNIPEQVPGESDEQMRDRVRRGARAQLEVGVPTAISLAIPGGSAAIPVATQLGRSRLWNFVQQVGPTVYKAIVTGLSADVAARAANFLDSEHYNDPELHGILTATGELSGVGAGGTVNAMRRAVAETPQGTTVRQTLESVGGQAPVSVTTKSPFLRSTSELLEHLPGGGRFRQIKEKARQLIDNELQQYQTHFRGGAVSGSPEQNIAQPVERSMLDLEAPLRPILPNRRQTTLDAQARLRPHLSMGTDQDLQYVPREVLRRVPEAIEQQQQATNKAFAHLRDVVNQSPVDARALKSSLQRTPAPPGTQNLSIFHDLEDIKKSLAMLPDTITADM